MKKLVIVATMMLLNACAAPQQEQINFIPKPTLSNSAVVDNAAFTLVSKDIRSAQYVALVDSGRNNIEPIHPKQNVRIALENALSEQFSSQGFRLTVNSENTLTLEVQELLVNVVHSITSNEMDAKVTLEVTAETPKGKLIKSYTGTAKRSAALSASNQDIEKVLNDVINLVLKEMANDDELKNYMKERFHG
ncbi:MULTISPECIES: YajG family lipoprotein [Vibrio]|uniref:YajG family lipoprotein n=1 Tax=Vibrio TaxID=662 RepID=UPI000C171828|nr:MULTISPECIES: YajG family lipoprotein [Vibrio]NAW68079.1 hypothetical protein [Vibrio sp. V28_P6S34P95]NAX06622.1 hypothetical protein [Vibrio sp. V30_P3S12P165]NAX33703.1 hypothetical protein [Vibrio sp. V29_P1S30P107]NAX38254.1 hypothetical protein [Vibrio sp. V27_P1S3P104]NAX41690.1 hypothetical protein [Vibrio sp. V26_P1S5P106]